MANINISKVGHGGTYTNLDSWWYSFLQNNNGDLVSRDIVEIAEVQAGTYVSSGNILTMTPISGVNTDAQRFFVIRADSNARFNGDTNNTPVRFNVFPTGTLVGFYSSVPYTRFEHLVVAQTGYITAHPRPGRTVGFEVVDGTIDSCGVLDIKRTSIGMTGVIQSVVGIKADSGCITRNNIITGLSTDLSTGNGAQTLTETIGILQQSPAAHIYNNTIYGLQSSNTLSTFIPKSKCHGFQYFDDGHPPGIDLGPVLWLDSFTNDRFAYSAIGAPGGNPLPLITFWYDRTPYANHGSGNTASVAFLFGHSSEGVDARGYSAAGLHLRKMRSMAPLADLSDGYTTFLLAKSKSPTLGGPAWFTTHISPTSDYYFYVGRNGNDHMVHKMASSLSGITIPYTTGIPLVDTWFILTAVYNATNGHIQTYFNGELASSGNYSPGSYTGLMAATVSDYSLAGQWEFVDTSWLNSNNVSGTFGAAVVYNRPLDTFQRQQVEYHLASRIPEFPSFINYGSPEFLNLKNNAILDSHTSLGSLPNSGDYYFGYQAVGYNNASNDNTAKNINWINHGADYSPTSMTGVDASSCFKSLVPFDAHLKTTAPIKNSGLPLTSFIWDVDGQVRGDSWDIGADEAGSGIDSQGINEVSLSLRSDYGIVEDSLTLYTLSQQVSEDSIDLYTYGAEASTSGIPLFLGNYYVEEGLPLVLGGDLTQSSMILFVKVAGDTLNSSIPLHTYSDGSEGGSPPGSSERSLTLVVGNSITGEETTSMNLVLTGGGPIGMSGGFPLYLESKGATSGIPLYVHAWAAGTGNNYIPMLVQGDNWNPLSDSFPMTVSGRIQVDTSMRLFLKSEVQSTHLTMPLFIYNSGLTKGLNLYTRGYSFGDPYVEGFPGSQGLQASMNLFINREYNSLAAWVPLTVVTSEGVSSGIVPLFTQGATGFANSGIPLSMHSYSDLSNNFQLYTHGF